MSEEAVAIPEPRPVQTYPARISMVQSLYFHPGQGEGKTEQFDSRYSQWLTQSEQPYVRVVEYNDENWKALDYGWVDPTRCSYLLIQHLGQSPSNPIQPTQTDKVDVGTIDIAAIIPAEENESNKPTSRTMFSERKSTKSTQKLLLISYLRPGTSLRLPLIDASMFVLKCRQGTARCNVTLLPD